MSIALFSDERLNGLIGKVKSEINRSTGTKKQRNSVTNFQPFDEGAEAGRKSAEVFRETLQGWKSTHPT